MSQYIAVLRNNPNFARVWGAQVVSLLGDWFNTISLSVLVAEYSDGSGLAISLFLMSRFLPPLLFSPIAGVIVDRFDRKAILVYCNLLRTGVVLALLLATSPNMLWLIYVLTILQFTLSGLFEPGQSSITPSLVKRQDLVIANTLNSVTWSVMLALGAIIGGLVAAIFGTAVALVIDAATFALAAYLISTIQVGQPVIATKVEQQDTGSFWQGVGYLKRHPQTAATVLVKGATSLGNADTIMTVFATQVFIIGASGQISLGILYSAFGIGAVLGPIALNRVNDGSIYRMRQLILIGLCWAFFGWLLIGWAATLMVVALAMGIRAMGSSVNWTYSTVVIQQSVPDQYLGRVFSMDWGFFQLATVISTVVHGYAIDLLNNRSMPLPLLDLHSTTFEVSRSLIANMSVANNLSMLALTTAIVSMVPVLLWTLLLVQIRKRNSVVAVPAD